MADPPSPKAGETPLNLASEPSSNQSGEPPEDVERLPAEMRNLLYECIARDDPSTKALLKSDENGGFQIQAWHPMLLVSKQIGHEFAGIAQLNATTLHANVYNFDFGHIIAFLDDLRADAQKSQPKHPTATDKPNFTIRIALDASEACALRIYCHEKDEPFFKWFRYICNFPNLEDMVCITYEWPKKPDIRITDGLVTDLLSGNPWCFELEGYAHLPVTERYKAMDAVPQFREGQYRVESHAEMMDTVYERWFPSPIWLRYP